MDNQNNLRDASSEDQPTSSSPSSDKSDGGYPKDEIRNGSVKGDGKTSLIKDMDALLKHMEDLSSNINNLVESGMGGWVKSIHTLSKDIDDFRRQLRERDFRQKLRERMGYEYAENYVITDEDNI